MRRQGGGGVPGEGGGETRGSVCGFARNEFTYFKKRMSRNKMSNVTATTTNVVDIVTAYSLLVVVVMFRVTYGRGSLRRP